MSPILGLLLPLLSQKDDILFGELEKRIESAKSLRLEFTVRSEQEGGVAPEKREFQSKGALWISGAAKLRYESRFEDPATGREDGLLFISDGTLLRTRHGTGRPVVVREAPANLSSIARSVLVRGGLGEILSLVGWANLDGKKDYKARLAMKDLRLEAATFHFSVMPLNTPDIFQKVELRFDPKSRDPRERRDQAELGDLGRISTTEIYDVLRLDEELAEDLFTWPQGK